MVSDQFRWNVFVFGTNFVCCIPAYWLPPERNKWSGDGRRPLWAEGELLDLMNGRMCAQIVLKYLGKISLICDPMAGSENWKTFFTQKMQTDGRSD